MPAWLLSVAVFAFVMAATPGPNNVLFAASGARVGYLRTLPGLAGMLGGFGCVLLACAAGVGELVAHSSAVRVAMTCAASVYMVWLASRLWRSGPVAADGSTAGQGADVVPLTWVRMAMLQVVNAKTWLACVTFVSGYLVAGAPDASAAAPVGVVVFLAVVLGSASLWVLFGAAVRARVRPEQWRLFNRVLAAAAVATVATFWL